MKRDILIMRCVYTRHDHNEEGYPHNEMHVYTCHDHNEEGYPHNEMHVYTYHDHNEEGYPHNEMHVYTHCIIMIIVWLRRETLIGCAIWILMSEVSVYSGKLIDIFAILEEFELSIAYNMLHEVSRLLSNA